ncbi:hypothetical protein D917_06001 [Trichinella nativa]|uniref:Uncharacterized protein n=1 Tax=Trichinella nativa TaxID=6335 RepID=A0A1Y3EZ80_9BILA|nr:hypothetical protein D917_06001 [Trichinella nativa]
MQPTADKQHLHCEICLTKEPRKIADLESDEEILKWKRRHYGKLSKNVVSYVSVEEHAIHN